MKTSEANLNGCWEFVFKMISCFMVLSFLFYLMFYFEEANLVLLCGFLLHSCFTCISSVSSLMSFLH